MTYLKEQKDKISNRRKVLETKKKAILSQSDDLGQPEITVDMLVDVSTRFKRVMVNADFATREKLVNLLVNSVTLMTNKAIVARNISLTNLYVFNLAPYHTLESMRLIPFEIELVL